MQFLTIPWYKGEEYFNTEITSRDELSKANEILKKAFSKFKTIISASSSAEIKDDVLYLDREDSGLTKKEKLLRNAGTDKKPEKSQEDSDSPFGNFPDDIPF